MSEPTNKELAAFLSDFANLHNKPDSASKDVACLLRLAAQRLEAREEITESKLLCAFEVYTRMRKAREAPGLDCMRAAFKAAMEFGP